MIDDKLTIYKQIARDALINWERLSKETATKIVQEKSNKELEQKVYAEGSINAAIKGFQEYSKKYLDKHEYGDPISESDVELFKEIIMTGKYRNGSADDFFEIIRKKIGLLKDDLREEHMATDTSNMIISVLSTIHDTWVKDNPNKFFTRDKKYQHMPIELIGWEEAKNDLLFLKPILEAMHLSDYVSEEILEQAYNQRVQAFLEEKGITFGIELIGQISKGAEFYPALEGQEDIIQALQDPKFVEEHIVSGIKDKGIGKNEQFAQQLFGNNYKFDSSLRGSINEINSHIKLSPSSKDRILTKIINNKQADKYGNTPERDTSGQQTELEGLRARKKALEKQSQEITNAEKSLIDSTGKQSPIHDE